VHFDILVPFLVIKILVLKIFISKIFILFRFTHSLSAGRRRLKTTRFPKPGASPSRRNLREMKGALVRLATEDTLFR
jgi:hypothetical protein